MPTVLPASPDLEQLRIQAKDLLRAYRERNEAALARVTAALPGFVGRGLTFRLTHAQAVIARDHGLASWQKLRAEVERLAHAAKPPPATRPPLTAPYLRLAPVPEVAEILIGLASNLEVEELTRVFQIGRRKTLAVREVMWNSGTHRIFVDALLVGARHHNPNVRYTCAHAMDMFADERCAAALLELLEDPVPRVRRVAVHSLACDDCKIVPLQPLVPARRSQRKRDLVAIVVAMALQDPSIQVRRHAAYALALFEDVRATHALETLLARETDEAIRRNALAALRKVRAAG